MRTEWSLIINNLRLGREKRGLSIGVIKSVYIGLRETLNETRWKIWGFG